jgi:hypothetical protein
MRYYLKTSKGHTYNIERMCDEKKYNQVVHWRRTHPKAIQRYNQEYYERNKERLRQKRRERYQQLKKSTLLQ